MAAFATVADYEARAAVTLAGVQLAQVTALLDDASALIRSRLPAGFEPDADMARAVTVGVVRRVMANPGGYRARTIGAYSETLGEDGGLYLTDDELAALLPAEQDPGTHAAYSVPLADQAPWGWSDPERHGCW